MNGLQKTPVPRAVIFPWIAVGIALAIVYAILVLPVNTNLTAGRYVLFMDERITFDGVYSILHAQSIKDFLWAVLDGGDQRYGRSLWTSIAVVAAAPAYLYGDAGQIIAVRIAQGVILILAFAMFAGLLVRWWLRLPLLLCLILMPFSDYYFTMPKPEPQQMLALAIFLIYFRKHDLDLGRSYWIWLGLAFGTKISTLPLIAIFAVGALVLHWRSDNLAGHTDKLIATLGYLLIGLGLAVPVLLPHILVSLLFFKLAVAAPGSWRRLWPLKVGLVMLLFAVNGLAAGWMYRSGIKTGLARWGSATFLNTSHGADQAHIHAADWLHYFLKNWIIVPPWALAFIAAATLTMTTTAVTMLARKGGWRQGTLGVCILGGGVILNLSIFASVHRLWGFYLFPGTVLAFVGLFYLADQLAEEASSLGPRLLSASFAVFAVAAALIWWLPAAHTTYTQLALRTKSPDYVRQLHIYNQIMQFLDNHTGHNKPLHVAFDPVLFPPQRNDHYVIEEFWGPFDWSNPTFDLIIFSHKHVPPFAPSVPADSPEFAGVQVEIQGYAHSVVSAGKAACSSQVCYEPVLLLDDGGAILARRRATGG